jgi:hypothetical protein
VEIVDMYGKRISWAQDVLTLSLNSINGAVLSGTLTKNAVNGVANFNNLGIDRAGTGYTLTVSGADFTSVTSNPFDLVI